MDLQGIIASKFINFVNDHAMIFIKNNLYSKMNSYEEPLELMKKKIG